jgi:hypothetical protein
VAQDYKDRRAAAKFEAENPNSSMPSAPRKEFASVYGDPNSAANSQGIMGLISGGADTGPTRERPLQKRLRQMREARKARKSSRKGLSSLLKPNVLYLMVTDLPSQEVLDRVAAQMEGPGA